MKWLKYSAPVIAILIVAAIVFVKHANRYQRDGEIELTGLYAPVKVVRDEKGMAYIYAKNLYDALRTQGFVTAQDRLFQMELTRLFAEGRISELAGEKAKALDIRMRTIGFHRHAKKHAKILEPSTKMFIQAYLDGVNQFIKRNKHLHLEFSLAGIEPGIWTIEDSLSILYLMGWNSAGNIETEIISQMLIEKVGIEKAKGIFPISTNPDDEEDIFTAAHRTDLPDTYARIPGLLYDKKMLSFLKTEKAPLKIGSNNWVVNSKRSESRKPVVANDPHLDSRILPGPWYPTGIITPQFRAVGVVIPGIPGMVVGRTDHIAIGVTNSYLDAQDLYIETLDPNNPESYMEGGASIPFQILKETLRIKDKSESDGFRKETITIKLTKRGPVVSDVMPDLKTKNIISMRWSPFETMAPSLGIENIFSAKNAAELISTLGDVTTVMLNFVFADDQGNIGWLTSGKIPVRSQGDSIVPFAVIDGKDNWIGWIPPDEMPQQMNPKRGWLGTCNHKTVKQDYPYYTSSYFLPYHRYARLKQLMNSKTRFTDDDHWRFQRDVMNLMAKQTVPAMIKALLVHEDTAKLGRILARWNYLDDKDQSAPAVFQSVYHNFAYLTFVDEFGDDLTKIMLDRTNYWNERLEKMVLNGASPWFDDISTDEKETMYGIFHSAGIKSIKELGDKYGSPEKWKWGEMHRFELVSPIMRKGPLKGFLGGDSHPMSGSCETLYRALYRYSDPFDVEISASLRMVADLGDNDRVLAVLPGGVCGRLFDKHTTDQIDAYMNGDKMYWWFSD
ncbi:MAG: penicillin acylase family protein, partial [Deltaproteobacteria bacterium]|nr:penicillin acylase family protein [Deltaproteobacteria bacterium]